MTSTPAAALVLEGCPTNIRLPDGSRATHVESDLFNIAERLREIDPSYQLCLLEHVDGRAVWAVTELSAYGVESLVFRVGPGCQIDELDARVIERVQYLRHVPVADRLRQLEAEADRERKARDYEASERMYENLGRTMYDNMSRLGFIDTPRAESRKPVNKTAQRHGRRA